MKRFLVVVSLLAGFCTKPTFALTSNWVGSTAIGYAGGGLLLAAGLGTVGSSTVQLVHDLRKNTRTANTFLDLEKQVQQAAEKSAYGLSGTEILDYLKILDQQLKQNVPQDRSGVTIKIVHHTFSILSFAGLVLLNAPTPVFSFEDISEREARQLGISDPEYQAYREQMDLLNYQLDDVVKFIYQSDQKAVSMKSVSKAWRSGVQISQNALRAAAKIFLEYRLSRDLESGEVIILK